MFDLTVVAKGGRWILEDEEGDALGDYASRAGVAARAVTARPGVSVARCVAKRTRLRAPPYPSRK